MKILVRFLEQLREIAFLNQMSIIPLGSTRQGTLLDYILQSHNNIRELTQSKQLAKKSFLFTGHSNWEHWFSPPGQELSLNICIFVSQAPTVSS